MLHISLGGTLGQALLLGMLQKYERKGCLGEKKCILKSASLHLLNIFWQTSKQIGYRLFELHINWSCCFVMLFNVTQVRESGLTATPT